jgi:lipopolysaccharide transport system permease protein
MPFRGLLGASNAHPSDDGRLQAAGAIESKETLPSPTTPVVHVRATTGWRAIDFAELWHYRELLWILGSRDVRVRYKQTALGVLWAIIPPLFTTLIFGAIFTLLKVTPQTVSNGVPYLLFAFTAQAPWQLFANSLSQSSNSLVGSQHLLTKVYFPRVVIPIASLFSAIVDFLVCIAILAGIMAWYREFIDLGWPILTLPLFTLLALATSLAVGLWMSALNVQYRDVRYVVPILVQLWMYVSPVIYSSASIPEKWRPLYAVNPMASVADGFRWALLGNSQPAPGPMLLISIVSVAAVLIAGLFYFKRMEKTFADLA